MKYVWVLLLVLSAGGGAFWAGAQGAQGGDKDQRIHLWEQSLAEGPVSIVGTIGSKVPNKDSVMFIDTVQIEFVASGRLDISTADFTAVDSKGWRNPARAIRFGGPDTDWAIPKPDCTINIEREVTQGEELTLEIAFCVNEDFDWESAKLHIGVPLQAVAQGSSTRPKVIRPNTIRPLKPESGRSISS